MSPRQGLRPHSLNTSSVNRRVSRYFDILIFCRRVLAAFGITHHEDQNAELSPARSTCQSTKSRQQAGAFKLRATPSLFQSENQSQYTAQTNIRIAAAKHATPPHRLPPENVKTPKSINIRYSKSTLKTETRKKMEKRAKMKEELKTRRQNMKYYFCAVIGVLSLLRKFTPR